MNDLLIYGCGTNVLILNANINGTITKIEINYSNISYQVTYYIEGIRKDIWIAEGEFSTSENKKPIGFK